MLVVTWEIIGIMEFFRKHQKVIMGIMLISFILWTIAPVIFALMAFLAKP